MQLDAYRLSLSTASAEAAGAFDRGMTGLLSWDRRTVEFFRRSVENDPGLAVAHAGLAVAHFVEEEFAEARSAMAAARACAAGGSEREQSSVIALDHYVHLRAADAEAAMRAHLGAWPEDLTIAQRLYLMWFFQGRFADMRELTDALIAVLPDDPFVHGLHAFVFEEQGDSEEAVRWAERCIERNPEDTWGVHALTHALYELAAYDEALERIPPALDACVHMNYYRNHMLWHLVLFRIAVGGYGRASEMCHEWFERERSPRGLDLRNTVSTLWRFELYGMDVGERWQPFVELLKRQLDRPEDSPFHHSHVGMALAGGRDWETAETHLDILRARGKASGNDIWERVVIPLNEAQHAFIRGEWDRVIEKTEPIRDEIVRLGGSKTQRDAFHDTLLAAALKSSDTGRARRWLDERLARRAEHFWSSRQPDV